MLGLHHSRGNLPGGRQVFAGIEQLLRGLFVVQLVEWIQFVRRIQLVEWVVGRDVQDGRGLVQPGHLLGVLRSGRQLPPGHLGHELRSPERLLRQLHHDEQDMRRRHLLVTVNARGGRWRNHNVNIAHQRKIFKAAWHGSSGGTIATPLSF
jgi:hypothetical protein